jgi:acetyl esterase/lipase
MLLTRLYLQLGQFLDYYTGEHEPSLSVAMREILNSQKPAFDGDNDVEHIAQSMRQVIPERHHILFPQFGVTSDWPPTLLWHGALDTAVPVHESCYMKTLLDGAGVPGVQLVVIEGQEHNFDYEPKAEARYGKQFDLVADFLKARLETRETELAI